MVQSVVTVYGSFEGFDGVDKDISLSRLVEGGLCFSFYSLGHWIFGFQYYVSAHEMKAMLYRDPSIDVKHKQLKLWTGSFVIILVYAIVIGFAIRNL